MVELTINGTRHSIAAPDAERLLDLLRWRLGLLGTKEGCRTGDCGACTVLVQGRPTLSCLTLSKELDGAEIVTVEGIDRIPVGRAVQSAFEEETGLQCGYCTPGFVVALTGLILDAPAPRSIDRLWADLQGNLCRCTGYGSIRRAVERAAREAP
ncbi:MAG: 2Fe-2S iron-sulfur cluster-binding protein [Thermoplasmata archaeon]|nr:2Fe-2S iron-sulfur cluster-binding protein [Thermoplasmata archaeon]